MNMRRYSSPPRSTSDSRSDVGWKLRERYLRRNAEVPITVDSNHGEGSVRSTRSMRTTRTNAPIPSGFGGSSSMRTSRSVGFGEEGPLGNRVGSRVRSRFASNRSSRNSDSDMSMDSTHSSSSTVSMRSTGSSRSSLGSALGRLPGRQRTIRGSSLGSGGLDKNSCHSISSRSSLSSARSSRYSSSAMTMGSSNSQNQGEIDPSLPPAFRVALRVEQQRRRIKNQKDDSSCLGSVASHCSTTANSTCDWESLKDGSDSDDSSIDSADSFAAMDSDDDSDDEAVIQSRTQLAKQELEMKNANKRRGRNSRFKSKSLSLGNSQPLGLIVEEK